MVDQEKFFQFLESISYRGMKPGLERVKSALPKLGNPQEKFKCIHIAGTNGKGSVCHLLTQFLGVQSYKIGLHSSPHVMSYRERFQVFDERCQVLPRRAEIPEILKAHDFVQECLGVDTDLTYFEYNVVLALVLFAQMEVDFAVFETGLGGRFDATNVIQARYCGITTVGYDHMHILGNSLEEILNEKIQICHENSLLLFGSGEPELIKQAQRYCDENHVKIYFPKHCERHPELKDKPETFFENYSFARSLLGLMEDDGIQIDFNKIDRLEKLYFPVARYELICQNPKIYIDGAHNEPALRAIKEHLDETLGGEYDLFFACLTDRDVRNLAQIILPKTGDVFWIGFSGLPRAPEDTGFYSAVQNEFGGEVFEVNEDLKTEILKPGRTKVICGSLYFCGQIKELFA